MADGRRFYFGDRGHVTLEIDLEQDTYQVIEPCGPEGPSPAAPLVWVAWRAALLIAAGAAVAIAGAIGTTMQFERPGRSGSVPLARVPQFEAWQPR